MVLALDIVECPAQAAIGIRADCRAVTPQSHELSSCGGFPAAGNSGSTDPMSGAGDHDVAMSYAVIWNSNGGPDCVGELELRPGLIHLLGAGKDIPEAHADVRLDDIASMYLERCGPSKNRREPALVLITRCGDRIAVGSLEGLGALHELAESVEHGRQHVAA